jgi:hypothetical protein
MPLVKPSPEAYQEESSERSQTPSQIIHLADQKINLGPDAPDVIRPESIERNNKRIYSLMSVLSNLEPDELNELFERQPSYEEVIKNLISVYRQIEMNRLRTGELMSLGERDFPGGEFAINSNRAEHLHTTVYSARRHFDRQRFAYPLGSHSFYMPLPKSLKASIEACGREPLRTQQLNEAVRNYVSKILAALETGIVDVAEASSGMLQNLENHTSAFRERVDERELLGETSDPQLRKDYMKLRKMAVATGVLSENATSRIVERNADFLLARYGKERLLLYKQMLQEELTTLESFALKRPDDQVLKNQSQELKVQLEGIKDLCDRKILAELESRGSIQVADEENTHYNHHLRSYSTPPSTRRESQAPDTVRDFGRLSWMGELAQSIIPGVKKAR